MEDHASNHGWQIKVVDRDLDLIQSKVESDNTEMQLGNLASMEVLASLIPGNDLVISLLPATMHARVAQICLDLKVNMATASYLSDELKELHREVSDKGLIFLNECGLDPGIDHLSAMRLLDEIRAAGGNITEFESFTGGLVAPEYENNPWKYKFTWNPRNVVVAGQGGAVKFIQQGKYKYIPYHKVFRRTEIVEIEGYGKFEGYANRDSLKYRSVYGLDDVQTMYRGTFRRPGFSKAWNCLVELGATDDSYVISNSAEMTHREFTNTFLAYHPTDSVELKLRQYLKIDQDDVDLWEKLTYLGLFSNEPIGLEAATPAQILEHILKKKWKLEEHDRDMIVMWHKITHDKKVTTSSLVVEGEDRLHTAMAKTVGLPLAIACKLILEGKITQRGCLLPITPEFYIPVLQELESFGIRFKDETVPMT